MCIYLLQLSVSLSLSSFKTLLHVFTGNVCVGLYGCPQLLARQCTHATYLSGSWSSGKVYRCLFLYQVMLSQPVTVSMYTGVRSTLKAFLGKPAVLLRRRNQRPWGGLARIFIVMDLINRVVLKPSIPLCIDSGSLIGFLASQ